MFPHPVAAVAVTVPTPAIPGFNEANPVEGLIFNMELDDHVTLDAEALAKTYE